MSLHISYLSVISSLLLSFKPIAVASSPGEWPYYLPQEAKYWPEDAPHRRRYDDGPAKLEVAAPHQTPNVVRMIGLDAGEKLWPGYWRNEDWRPTPIEVLNRRDQPQPTCDPPRRGREGGGGRSVVSEDESERYSNSSLIPHHRPPLKLHSQSPLHHSPRDASYLRSFFRRSPGSALSLLNKRAFQCPANSSSCASIGRPNSCCSQGEVCNIITDTGLGDVGCCPAGAANGCSGTLLGCNLGFTQCSDSLGGGCCIPQYVCVDVGCGPGPSLISLIVTTPTTTVISNPPLPSVSRTRFDINTGPQNTLPCSSQFKACPASLGGGCCRTDRDCGATDCPAPTTASSASSSTSSSPSASVSAFNVPARPTSLPSTGSTAPLTTAVSTFTGTVCPSAFYQCNAYLHGGGCCRVGRDCGLTSCPTSSSTTVVNGQGVTILEPLPSTTLTNRLPPTTTPTGTGPRPSDPNLNCPTTPSAWITCINPDGCCPPGYVCAPRGQCYTATSVSGSPGANRTVVVNQVTGRSTATIVSGAGVVGFAVVGVACLVGALLL